MVEVDQRDFVGVFFELGDGVGDEWVGYLGEVAVGKFFGAVERGVEEEVICGFDGGFELVIIRGPVVDIGAVEEYVVDQICVSVGEIGAVGDGDLRDSEVGGEYG